MALTTVEGVYEHGGVKLAERPNEAPEGARVLVTFLAESPLHERSSAEREKVLARILARMEQGYRLGGSPYPTREEIYRERLDLLR